MILPVTRGAKKFVFLMAGKKAKRMYHENFIQRRREENIKRNREKQERSLFVVTLDSKKEKEVKQERAQGGCLGTKSRRKT
jgi:hypothetical protein